MPRRNRGRRRWQQRKPPRELRVISADKAETARLIRLTELDGNRKRNEEFRARWARLCSEELRAMVEASKARKAATA